MADIVAPPPSPFPTVMTADAPVAPSTATTKVALVIPQRPEYGNVYYALKRPFASGGPYVVDVTAAELHQLREDPVLILIEDLSSLSPVVPAAPVAPGKRILKV